MISGSFTHWQYIRMMNCLEVAHAVDPEAILKEEMAEAHAKEMAE